MATPKVADRPQKRDDSPGEIRICRSCKFSKYYGAYQRPICPICGSSTATLTDTGRSD